MPARLSLVGIVLLFGSFSAFSAPPAANTFPVRKLNLDIDPAELTIHNGKLYASGFHAGRVTSLSLLTGKKLGETRLDGYERMVEREVYGKKVPTRVVHHYAGGAITHAAGKLFVVQTFSGSLLVIDPDSMRVIKRLALGGNGTLAVTPDGKTVVCAPNELEEFYLIDTATYKHTTIPYHAGGKGCLALAASPDGQFVVLAHQRGGQPRDGKTVINNGNAFLAMYDLTQQKYATTLYLASSDTESVSEFVHGLAYSPDGRTLYAGMFQAKTGIRVIDPIKWRIIEDIQFVPNSRNEYFKWTNPIGLAFFRDWLFVANRENQEVMVIDAKTRKPVARLMFAKEQHAFRHIRTEGDRIYIVDQCAVYELDGWALARQLAARAEKGDRSLLDLTLAVREE